MRNLKKANTILLILILLYVSVSMSFNTAHFLMHSFNSHNDTCECSICNFVKTNMQNKVIVSATVSVLFVMAFFKIFSTNYAKNLIKNNTLVSMHTRLDN